MVEPLEKLVLFDIDETMIHSDGVGRRALGRALNEVFGTQRVISGIKFSGKTDPQIISEVLNQNRIDVPDISVKLESAFEIYTGYLQEEIDRAEEFSLHTGVSEILARLNSHHKAFLGLLTGNIEEGARIKLNRFDLNHYFPIGAFGSDSADRNDLPEIARSKAEAKFNMNFSPRNLIVIGDSVNDIVCARKAGAVSIVVNTGKTPRSDLVANNPDYLFETLADTDSLMNSILD